MKKLFSLFLLIYSCTVWCAATQRTTMCLDYYFKQGDMVPVIESSETRDDGGYEGKSLLDIIAIWEIPHWHFY